MVSFVAVLVAAFVLVIVGAVKGLGESDKYGRVPMPGQAILRLPAGEVSVYYEEHSQARNPRPPGGFEYEVLPVGGGAALDERGSGVFNETVTAGGTSRVRYGRIDVPKAGAYAVSASFTGEAGAEPALTFGDSFTSSIWERLRWAGLGLIGIAAAAVLALGTFLRRRLAPEDERVTMPPDAQ